MVVVVCSYDHLDGYAEHIMLLDTIIITMGLNIMVMQAMMVHQ